MVQLTITVPDNCEQYTNDIKAFVDAMLFKLGKNAHKGRWGDLDKPTALRLLREEVKELTEAMSRKRNVVETMLEAADVANFAMMLCSMAMEGR